jgi:hypothetical protein
LSHDKKTFWTKSFWTKSFLEIKNILDKIIVDRIILAKIILDLSVPVKRVSDPLTDGDGVHARRVPVAVAVVAVHAAVAAGPHVNHTKAVPSLQ